VKKVLILCDSHGTKWGATGYAWRVKDMLTDFDIDILEYGGISLNKIVQDIEKSQVDLESYDVVIMGVGNPDIHPRMPKRFMNLLKKFRLTFVKDSYFSIPPVVNLSYIARIPFFIFRLVVIRFIHETYLDQKSFLYWIRRLIQHRTKKIVIIPLLFVNPLVYTDRHNRSAKELNDTLSELYKDSFLRDEFFQYNNYKRYHNCDFFHFNDTFHQKLSNHLVKELRNYKI